MPFLAKRTWNMSFFNRDIWDGPMSLSEMDLALDDSLDGIIGRQYDDNGVVIQGGLIETKDLDAKILQPLLFRKIYKGRDYDLFLRAT